jgi:outer membrane protein insertion porin family
MKKFILLTILFSTLIFSESFATSYRKIIIKGNQRVSESTIRSYIPNIKENKNISTDELNNSIKKLYRTGLFLDIDINKSNFTLTITITENPMISEIAFEGNKNLDDNILEMEILLKKRSILTKNKLRDDTKRISDIYKRVGRFNARVTPKIIKGKQNRVKLVFEIKEGKKTKVKKITFVGNKAYDDRDLESVISTKEASLLRFGYRELYDPDRVNFDKELLRRFYTSKGYADFKVISSIAQLSPKKDSFSITILLEEGQKYKFGEIKTISRIKNFDAEILQKEIELKEGRRYNSKKIEKTLDNIDKKMGEFGYAFVNIEPAMTKNIEAKTIDIKFTIQEAPKIYIDNIDIIGNTRTIDEVIRRELRIKEGDPYNNLQIKRSKERIANLGFFSDVQIDIEKSRTDYDKVNLIVKVTEQKTGELEFGIGYSTVDKLNFNLGISEKNLLGTGRRLSFKANKTSYTESFSFAYEKPYFTNRDLFFGYSLFKSKQENRDSVGYNKKSSGFSVSGSYSITEYLSHRVSYSFIKQEVSDMHPDYNGLVEEGKYDTSMLGQTFLYDRRDSIENPTEGFFIRLGQDYAGFGEDTKYFKQVASAAYYVPLVGRSFILKLSANGGFIDGIGEPVKTNEAFYLGGNSFKGFQYAGIGPRLKDTTSGSAVGGIAVGGTSYYMAEAETKFPLGLPKEYGISGISFINAGTLTGVDAQTNLAGKRIYDKDSIRSAYGIGVMWRSPMGPVRLDFTNTLAKEDFDEEENFRFSFGSTF